MKRIDKIFCLIIFLTALLSRFPFVEQFQSHWDGPQYSIAIIRYSFEQQTPAPLGYPLYITLGKIFYLFFHDPHKALLAVSVFGSIAGGIILYFVGKAIYNRHVGIAATVIFLTGSTFYYFGLTAYAYGLIPAMTTFLAFIVYQIFIKKRQPGLSLGIVFSICFGIRPQEVMQIGALALIGFLFLSKKEKIKSLVVFILTTLLWFIPVLFVVGGVQKYFSLSQNFATTAFTSTPFKQHAVLMIKGFLLSCGLSGVFLFYYLTKIKNIKKSLIKHKKIIIFYATWIIPGILFNVIIRTDHAGYQMSYLSGLLILIAHAIWQTTKKHKFLFVLVLIIIACFNLYWFFYDRDPSYTKPYRPTSFHFSDIRKNDIKTGSKVNFVLRNFDSRKTMIVSTEVLWRPYSYYLKDYSYVALFRLDNTTIPYSYNRIYSKDWNMHWYRDKEFILTIPSHISTIVFMDDLVPVWIKNYPFKQYKLPGNAVVTYISVSSGSKIVYNYHEIKVEVTSI